MGKKGEMREFHRLKQRKEKKKNEQKKIEIAPHSPSSRVKQPAHLARLVGGERRMRHTFSYSVGLAIYIYSEIVVGLLKVPVRFCGVRSLRCGLLALVCPPLMVFASFLIRSILASH